MRFFIFGLFLFLAPSLAISGTPYVGLSLGTSLETHTFDVWNGAESPGRRALTGRSASSDQAIVIGVHDAIRFAGRSFDLELEVFDRRSAHFNANGAGGSSATQIKTRSLLAAVWTPLYRNEKWSLYLGAGVGARESIYKMDGVGVSIKAYDHAPYAMVGVRVLRPISPRVSVVGEWRAHTRPQVKLHAARWAFSGPLEHDSKGYTLRVGLQIKLGR